MQYILGFIANLTLWDVQTVSVKLKMIAGVKLLSRLTTTALHLAHFLIQGYISWEMRLLLEISVQNRQIVQPTCILWHNTASSSQNSHEARLNP